MKKKKKRAGSAKRHVATPGVLPKTLTGKSERKRKLLSRKSLYKTITWRIISTGISFGLSLLFMESIVASIGFTVAHAIISTVFYYGHEVAYKVLRDRGLV